MPVYGWQILFWIGGLVPIAIAVCLCFALPESPKFLALRPHRRAELAALMARMEPGVKLAADASFVIQEEENRGGISLRKLFVGRLAVLSPLLWCCVFICMMVFYFASSWLPTLLATSGVPIERAALATTLFQFGGTLGGWSIMRPMDKYGMIPCTILYVLTIPIIACLGLAGNSETLVLALSAAAGFCLLGLNFGQISASSNIYPTSIRANGVGWFFFFARMGGMCGPLAAGLLIGWHVSTSSLFYLAAVPLAVGSVASVLVTRLYWLHYERPSREEVMAGTVAVAAKAID